MTGNNLSHLKGLIAAPFTPMNDDGMLNLRVIDRYAEYLVRSGVAGVFVCGTTGEGMSLSTDERLQVAARWVQAGGKDLKTIVHTGHLSLAEAKTIAADAQRIGAYATAALSPHFYKPVSTDSLVAICAEIAGAAPGLPFYYYHFPLMTGIDVPVSLFLVAAEKRIPNLAGVKFTHNDMLDYAASREVADGRFDMLFGRDEMLLAALAFGARGAVGSTYNYAAPIYHRLIGAFDAGALDEARRQQAIVNASTAAMVRHGGLRAGKAIMAMVGVDCGAVRLPFMRLSVEEQNCLRQDLEALDFFAHAQPA